MEVNIVFFSDTHNKHKKVVLPPCDIAIFCGDMSSQGYKHEVRDFFSWFSKQHQCVHKIAIAGNHDRCFDAKFDSELHGNEWLPDLLKEFNSSITYLQNNSTEIYGLKIWGSPVTPWFHGDNWAFNRFRGEEIRQVWANIPRDTDIVVTHGPVMYKVDYNDQDQQYVGCEDLRYLLKIIKPKVHACGHIHESYGAEYDEDTTYVNASICNLRYEPINKPIEVSITI
jgi:Icc-related predicted phosphoesterase